MEQTTENLFKSGDHVIVGETPWMVWEDKGIGGVMVFNFHGAVTVAPRPLVKLDVSWHNPPNEKS